MPLKIIEVRVTGHECQRNHDIASLCPFRAEYEGHEVGRNGSRAEEYGAGHKRAGACYPQIGGHDLPRFVRHLPECGKGCGMTRLYANAEIGRASCRERGSKYG